MQHVAVTSSGAVATLYINGAQAAQNTAMTLSPASLGTTSRNWLGRSQFSSDPFLTGQIDNFRLYDRALSAAEIQELFQSTSDASAALSVARFLVRASR